MSMPVCNSRGRERSLVSGLDNEWQAGRSRSRRYARSRYGPGRARVVDGVSRKEQRSVRRYSVQPLKLHYLHPADTQRKVAKWQT